jgi:hypothetical protein
VLRLTRALPALLGYLLLGVLSFTPQSLRPHDTIAYVGDSLESVYIVAWNARQAVRAPGALFEANVLHPLPHALAFTDHRLLPSLLVAPVVWLSGNPVLAYNLAVLAACVFAALAGRYLGVRLGLSPLAAWAAGALYGFHTYQVNEAPRLNIVWHGFLPLALASLLAYLATGERRQAFATAGLLLLQGLSSNYHLLYGVLLVGVVLLLGLAARPRLVLRRLPALALAGSLAALAFLPIAWPYLRLAREHALSREPPPGVDLVHFLSTSPGNWIYGPLGAEVRLQQRGPHFVGLVSLALALGALAAALRDRRAASALREPLLPVRAWVPAAALLAALFVTLSLGSELVAFGRSLGDGPYRLLYDHVPGFRLVRIPERLSLLAMLFVALLAGRGLQLLEEGGSRPLALCLALLVPAEHLGTLPVSQRVPVAGALPEVYRFLAREGGGAVAELPARGEALVREETLEMYFSTAHWRPIVHGYTAYPPLVTRLLRRLLAELPSEASFAGLARVGVDTLVVHRGREVGTDLFNQTPGLGEARRERWRERLRAAGLDLYERLPAAVASGALVPIARFEGPSARLFDSQGDDVYRIVHGPALAPAPMPSGRRVREPLWRYRAKAGDAALAGDGDLDTAWVVARPLRGDEFAEIQFDRPLPVSGVVLRLRRDSAFPTRFRIGARDLEGRWAEVARYDGPHRLQLLESALGGPALARVGFALSGRPVTGVNLLVEEGGTSVEGWRLPELEIWVP